MEIQSLQIFEFTQQNDIDLDYRMRVATIDGNPWFVAKDIAEAMGYTWQPALIKHVPDDWKGITRINTLGGSQDMAILSEQGLYFFLNRSDKPAALPLQKYVSGEVLPSIRKHGGYLTPQLTSSALNDPNQLIGLLKASVQQLEAFQAKCKLQETEIKYLAPRAGYADDVLQSAGLHTVDSIAVHLGISAIKMNRWLASKGHIYKRGKNWYPEASLRSKGLCDFHIVPYIDRDGNKQTNEHLKWTEQGRKWICEQWEKSNQENKA